MATGAFFESSGLDRLFHDPLHHGLVNVIPPLFAGLPIVSAIALGKYELQWPVAIGVRVLPSQSSGNLGAPETVFHVLCANSAYLVLMPS